MSNSHMFRKARTRTLIQGGGLLEKAELFALFDIQLGQDLQMDEDVKENALVLLGALASLANDIRRGDYSRDLWKERGIKIINSDHEKIT